MYTGKTKHIINGTVAIILLALWFLAWRVDASSSTGRTFTSVTEHGVTREVITSDRKIVDQYYMPTLVSGLYGAIVASILVFCTRRNADRLLYVLLATAGAVVSGIVLSMLIVAIFYPNDPATSQGEIGRRLIPALAGGVIYGIGFSILIGAPALLGAFATSSFLKAIGDQAHSPPPLPG